MCGPRSKLKAIRSFAYTESRIDHRQHAKIPFDMAIVAFEAGVVARSGEGRSSEPFTHWTIGTHKAEGTISGASISTRPW